MGMIDVSNKKIIYRKAIASGRIILSHTSILSIQAGEIKKGDPLLVGEVAGMNAAKQTHLLVPHCHQIPLDTVRIDFHIEENQIVAQCFVSAHARTGVEMEALVGVTIALNTVWDMVKYLEKDENGQYPITTITDIRVLKKEKIE